MMSFTKKLIVIVPLFYCWSIYSEGIAFGTLVKTLDGYTAIENIQVNDYVVCCDENNSVVVKPVLFVCKKLVRSYVYVCVNNEHLVVAADQLFFDGIHHKWIQADKLCVDDCVCSAHGKKYFVQYVECIHEPTELYCLCVKDIHNFCISSSDIIVHNFVPVIAVAAWAFGTGGIELVSLGIGFLGGSLFGYSLYKKHQNAKSSHSISVGSFNGGMYPEDPNDDDEELTPEEKKRNRNEKRKEHKPLTNAEAREEAKKLRYREVKDHPCGNTRGKPVFYNEKKYISPDADGHSGGHWKVFDLRGNLLYAMDKVLKKMCRIYK